MKKSKQKDSVEEEAPQGVALTSRWTQGAVLRQRLLAGLIVVGAASGALAFAGNLLPNPKPQAAAASNDGALTTTQQDAGAFSIGYVGAWLGASKKAHTELDRYVQLSSTTLSDAPWSYRDIAVASVTPGTTDGVITVVVSANVQEPSADPENVDASNWPRRYFQVAVTANATTFTPLGLPAPIAAPAIKTTQPVYPYPITLGVSDAAGTAVEAFLGAYLAGSGDLDRYISPDATIAAVTPAPYVSITTANITADKEAAVTPADGTELSTLTTATVTNALEQSLQATYAIELKARGGRWEVTAIATSPVLSSDSAKKTAPTPEPTSTPTPTAP